VCSARIVARGLIGGARGAVARAADPARTINIDRSEQSPQGDLLGVLVPRGPTAVRTAAALGQGFGDLRGDQHLLQGGEQLVGFGQMEADQVRAQGFAREGEHLTAHR